MSPGLGGRGAPVAVLALLLLLAWFLLAVVIPSARRHTHGFGAYYTASRLLAEGRISPSIYDPDTFSSQVERDSQGQTSDIFNANPPTTSLMLWGLAFLPAEQARLAWTALNLLFLLAGLAILSKSWTARSDLVTFALIFASALFFQPVIANFRFGQAYILMFFLLAIAAVGFEKHKEGLAGTPLALALVLKLSGWPLLFFLAWRRRWRTLLWAAGVAAAVVLLTLPLLPLQMWWRFLQLLPEVTGSPLICVTAYQTTRSFLCHLFAPAVNWFEAPALALPWQATFVFVLLALIALAASLRLAKKDPMAAFGATIVWSILFAPLGEQHHHVVVLIPLTWLIARWRNKRLDGTVARAALFLALLCYLLPFPYLDPPLQRGWWALLAYPRLYGAWFTLLALVAATGASRRQKAG